MPKHQQGAAKINLQWVREARRHFRSFLEETGFPAPERNGTRGSTFDYPEWMVMFIAVLAVKARVKSYRSIHRLAVQYWPQVAPGTGLEPISESQLRERLKKISVEPGRTPTFVLQVFPREVLEADGAPRHRERGQDAHAGEGARVA